MNEDNEDKDVRKQDAEPPPPSPVLARRGSRRHAGADTPAGTQTRRSVKPAKREQEEREQRKRDEDSETP